MRDGMVDQIVDRVIAVLRPELEAIRQLVERAPVSAESAEPAGPLLTREELAASLRLSEATLKRWDQQGCPRVLIGERLPRYRLADVLAWRSAMPQKVATPARAKPAPVRLLTRGRR
ncbi:hypothetical protein WMF30_11005 [Sorangium sp. So ce134]